MRKKFLALSLAVIVSAAQVMTVSASKQEKLQQQQAAQAAMLLNRAGFHAQAKAIWDAAKGVIAQ